MAGSKYVQCVGPSYHLADRKSACQSSVNCYPTKLDGDTWIMDGTPGEVEIVDLGSEIRGSRVAQDRWFEVSGDTLYELTSAGASTNRGTLSSNTGYVSMANNVTQLALVDGTYLYILNLDTNVFTRISSSGWIGSDNVTEQDGYFVFADPETQQFYLSAIDDGTDLDALDFSSADSSPDDIIAHTSWHRQLLFFGSLSAEIWIDSGLATFPFTRYGSYTLDVGIVGKHAFINAADTVFWIGKTPRGTGIVYMMSGNQPVRVSTNAVEEALKDSSDLSQATMWSYQTIGHEFIGINAPGLDTTWVFDAAHSVWHERGEWDAEWEPLRSRFVTAFEGEHFAGDSTGSVVRLDSTVYTLNGRTLKRERTWPHMISPAMEPISYFGLELAMRTGHGGGQVRLEISNDGGASYLSPLTRSLGVVGRWLQKVRWNNLGTSFNRVFRISISDAVPFTLYSASVNGK